MYVLLIIQVKFAFYSVLVCTFYCNVRKEYWPAQFEYFYWVPNSGFAPFFHNLSPVITEIAVPERTGEQKGAKQAPGLVINNNQNN